MIEKIISSKSRLQILDIFFSNDGEAYYPQEVVKSTGLDPANVKKEFANLVEGGFLTISKKKGRRLYTLNKENKYFESLVQLFSVYRGEHKRCRTSRRFLGQEFRRNRQTSRLRPQPPYRFII